MPTLPVIASLLCLLALATIGSSSVATPPSCPSELCEADAEERPCSDNSSGRICWTLQDETIGNCTCCKSCSKPTRLRPCIYLCRICPNGTVLSPTPNNCCQCVRDPCANVRCISCPEGSVLSLVPNDCCRCVPVPGEIDCSAVSCVVCPQGTVLQPSPGDCCKCVEP